MTENDRGKYLGLNRGPDAVAQHNRTDPPHAARVAGEPAAALLACPADARRLDHNTIVAKARQGGVTLRSPFHRGSVQDESGALDPVDAQAMRDVEGHGA